MGRRSDDRGGPREFDRPKGPRETGMNRVCGTQHAREALLTFGSFRLFRIGWL